MKTICIDARLYGISHTGIGRYVENLIRNLPSQISAKIVLIVAPDNYSNPQIQKFNKFIAKHHPYSPLAQLEMLGLWLKIRPDLLHVTHSSIPVFWPGKIVVTFHDLIKHYSVGPATTTHKNTVYYWIKYIGYLFVDTMSVFRASHIIVPSAYWKHELVKKYHLDPVKVTVTYEGVDKNISTNTSHPIPHVPPPFVIYTGNVYPHKNLDVLIKAVTSLNGQVHLALVGARSVFTDRLVELISKYKGERFIHILGRVADSDLANLYHKASAFVFPSLIEGFGLTGLEAMANGLPVIAARASCLPEVYEDAAIYFDPHDSADLKEKILQVVSNKALRLDLIKKGLSQVKKYSWAKMGKETWAIYQQELR